jgi:hypothetical protein
LFIFKAQVKNRLQSPAAAILALVSGTAGLAWQGLWTVQFSATLGHEWVQHWV